MVHSHALGRTLGELRLTLVSCSRLPPAVIRAGTLESRPHRRGRGVDLHFKVGLAGPGSRRRNPDRPPLGSLIALVKGLFLGCRVLAGLRVLSAVDLADRRMLALDGGSAEVVHALIEKESIGISGDGLIRAMRPGGDAPLKPRSGSRVADHAASLLQRNSVLVFHIAWRVTASLRATATRAFLNPEVFASRRPQAFRVEKAVVRVSRVVAAS